MSTRTVGGAMGMPGQFGTRTGAQIVPLSVFFLRMQGKEVETEDPKKKRKGKRGKRSVNAASPKAVQDQDQTVGGGHDEVLKAVGGKASDAEESVAGSHRFGTTRAMSGSMGSGNIAYHVEPLGVPLRRTAPWMGGKKKKRRANTEMQKQELIGRLLTM